MFEPNISPSLNVWAKQFNRLKCSATKPLVTLTNDYKVTRSSHPCLGTIIAPANVPEQSVVATNLHIAHTVVIIVTNPCLDLSTIFDDPTGSLKISVKMLFQTVEMFELNI